MWIIQSHARILWGIYKQYINFQHNNLFNYYIKCFTKGQKYHWSWRLIWQSSNCSLQVLILEETPSSNQPANQWRLSAIFPEVMKTRPEITSTWSYTSISNASVWLGPYVSTGKTLQIYSHCNRRIFILHHTFLQRFRHWDEKLRAGRSGVRIPSGWRDFSLVQNRAHPFRGPTSLLGEGYRGLFPVDTAAWASTTQLHLASKLRMSGAIHLLPPYALMTRRGTSSLYMNSVCQ